MNRNLASALTLAAVAAAAAAAAAALIVPAPAFADDITIDTTPFVSTRSRAEVRAELLGRSEAATSSGSEWARQLNEPSPFKSRYTPGQVREEYRAARQEVNALYAEDSGSSYFKMKPANPAASMGAAAR